YLPESQRVAVSDTVVSRRVLQPHGIFRRSSIEIGSQHIAVLNELAFVPALSPDPVTGLNLHGLCAHPLDDLGNTGCIAELYFRDLTEPAVCDVRVRVNQPGRSGSPMEINDARMRSRECEDGPVRTDSEDLPVTDRDRLTDRVMSIDGQNCAVC